MKYFFALLIIFSLSACHSFVVPDTQAKLSFDHLETIPLDVYQLQILEAFTILTENKNFLLEESPRKTLRRLIQSKVELSPKAPEDSFIRFHLMEAKINQTEKKNRYFFEGFIKCHIEAKNTVRGIHVFIDIDLFAFRDAPLDITLIERDDILFSLNEELMTKFYKTLKKEFLIKASPLLLRKGNQTA